MAGATLSQAVGLPEISCKPWTATQIKIKTVFCHGKKFTSQTPKAYSLPTPLAGSPLKTGERSTVNYIFLAIVLGTLGISNRISRRLKKQYVGRERLRSHRSKVFGIVTVEVLIWIGFNVFWAFSMANWMFISIMGVVMIGMIVSRKKRRYA